MRQDKTIIMVTVKQWIFTQSNMQPISSSLLMQERIIILYPKTIFSFENFAPGLGVIPIAKVNSDLILDNFVLAIGNTPFYKNSGTYLFEVVFKFEYISPANVLTGYEEHNNIYRNYSREQKTAILNKMDNDKLPYEINRMHLHHLHLALNPNRGAKGVRVLKVVAVGIAGLVVFAILKK